MPVSIITGASRGLGRALAAGLTAVGWQVVADARNAAALTDSVAGLGRSAHSVVALLP